MSRKLRDVKTEAPAAPSAELLALIDTYRTAQRVNVESYERAAQIPADLPDAERMRLHDEIVDPPYAARWAAHDAIRLFRCRSWAEFAEKAMALAGDVDIGPCPDPEVQVLCALLQDVHELSGLFPIGDKPTGQYSTENWWPEGSTS